MIRSWGQIRQIRPPSLVDYVEPSSASTSCCDARSVARRQGRCSCTVVKDPVLRVQASANGTTVTHHVDVREISSCAPNALASPAPTLLARRPASCVARSAVADEQSHTTATDAASVALRHLRDAAAPASAAARPRGGAVACPSSGAHSSRTRCSTGAARAAC